MPGYHAKKRLGQNFLKSDDVIQRLVREIDPKPDRPIVEIGPGRGALTLAMAESGAEIVAVEFDRDVIGYLTKLLRKHDNVSILNEDFLNVDLTLLPDRFFAVGNLPFNITSPVIDFVVRHRSRLAGCVFLIQKEVAERLSATHGSKLWSPIAINTQLHYHVEYLFSVPAKDFRPQPKVDAAVVRLLPFESEPIKYDFQFEIVVRHAFARRRKLLINNLVPEIIPGAQVAKAILADMDLPANVRAEQLTIEQFCDLTALLVQNELI